MARNLVTNPSAEVNTTGWAGESGTVSRVTDVAASGAASFALEAAHASWGYGGSAAAKNAASAPLIDLGALGVARCLWLPGTAGNFISTPDVNMLPANSDSFEDGTTVGAWTSVNSALSNVATNAVHGIRAMRVVCSAGGDYGAAIAHSVAVGATVTVSASITAATGPRTIDIIIGGVSQRFTVQANATTRLVATLTTADAGALQIIDNGGAGGTEFFIDAIQLQLGSVASAFTPSLRVTGDLDLRAHVAIDNLGTATALLYKWGSSGSGARAFAWLLTSARNIQLAWSPDGTAQIDAFSTIQIPNDSSASWLRVTLDIDNGASGRTVRFYTSPDGVTWTQLGVDVVQAGVTSIAPGSAEMRLGITELGGLPLKGKVLTASVRAGIGGAVVAAYDATAHSATTYTDSTGKVWTISRSGDATAEIVDRNTWAFTGTEYLTLPDRNELDFGAGEAFTLAIGAQSRAAGDLVLLTKQQGSGETGYVLWKWNGDGTPYFSTASGGVNIQANKAGAGALTDGGWHTLVGERGTSLRVLLDGAAGTSTADTLTTSLANANAFVIGGYGTGGARALVQWAALFRRVLTATEHSALAAWNGTAATEPTWLRDAAVLYVNADDSAQRSAYTATNDILNLAANPSLVGTAVAVTAAQTVHLSAAALTKPGGVQRTLASGLRWLDAGGATISEITGTEVAANGSRVALEAVAPTGAVNFKPVFSSPNLRAGDGLRVDAAMAVISAYRGAYFDGSTPGARWAGTANASISILPEVIATTVSSVDGRIGIDLVDLPDDAERTIWRVGPSGAREAVRAADPAPVSGGVYFAWDYEAPINESVRYEVDRTGGVYVSATVILESEIPWLRSPYLPTLNRQVRMARKPERERRRPRQIIPILGSKYPVVRFGLLQSESGTIRFWTSTDQEARDLVALLEQGTVQLAVPNERFGTQYLSLGIVREEPATAYADGSASAAVSWWNVEFDSIGRPVGPAVGGPGTTWQAVKDRHANWQDVRDTYASWLELLRGVAE